LGYEVHFAGVNLSREEREATLPHVDQWVATFERPQRRLKFFRRVASKLLHFAKSWSPSAIRSIRFRTRDIDYLMYRHWLDDARMLQHREQYKRVLVAYVFYSGFLEAFPPTTRKVIDTHDVFADRDARLAASGLSAENGWISMSPAEEVKGLLRADVILGIQHHEANYFRSVLQGSREVRTVVHVPEPHVMPISQQCENMIGFLAGANRLNTAGFKWFAEHVWPLVVRQNPKLRLLVAGGICKELEFLPANAISLGPLGDARQLYSRCMVTINPTFAGTGLKIKTVESFACSRACVATPHAAEGLEEFNGNGLFVADSSNSFAETIVRLCSDRFLAEQAGNSAFNQFMKWRQRSIDELRLALGGT
jgi:glycosyltransferase involved in cell wall biosynthesis